MTYFSISAKSHNRSLMSRSGSALIAVLLALALVSALGANALLTAGFEHTITGNFRKQALAFETAEAGLELCIAQIRHDIQWRGDRPSSAPTGTSGTLGSGAQSATFTATLWDGSDDSRGLYDPLIPADHVKIRSTGSVSNALQRVECLVRLNPEPGSRADSPYVAVVTEGEDTTSGPHHINGYDNDGRLDDAPLPNDMVWTNSDRMPKVNTDALRAFADFSLDCLTDVLPGQTGFWKDAPLNTRPWIIHVSGNLKIDGKRTLYGIIFVEGNSVILGGMARVEGIIYAPNTTKPFEINGGGISSENSVMGQVLAGKGGIEASGNHCDAQLVTEYVDAFNNYAGPLVNVTPLPGTWRQF
ncbi:MAG: hypothetical protein V1793_22400 [Pseudomonadota bacterium]